MKLKFRKEVGLSEIIAGLALLISIIVGIHECAPEKSKIVINTGVVIPGTYDDNYGNTRGYYFIKSILTNNGEKPVSYLGALLPEKFIIIKSIEKDSTINIRNPQNISINYLPETINCNDLENDTSILRAINSNKIDRIFYNNKKIDPGESITLTLLVTYDIHGENTEKSEVFINRSPILLFSDNRKIYMFPDKNVTMIKKIE